LRLSDINPRAAAARLGRLLYPFAAGIAVFIAYPSLVAFQDVAAMSPRPLEQPWLAHIPQAPGSMVLTASVNPSAPSQAAELAPAAPLPVSTAVRDRPLPQRINRTAKGDRVIQASASRPPANFSAGSVLERQSMLAPHPDDEKVELAFVRPRPADEVLKIALAFHSSAPEIPPVEPDLPVMVASLIEESAPNVMAFAPEPALRRSPFAAVLDDQAPIALVPLLGEKDHDWAADPLPLSTYSDREQHCLTAGIYFEARGEPVRGQAAVAQVILNRVRNPEYPNTACGVVYQNKDWRNRCQFSFACDRIKDNIRDPERWKIAQYVARETTEGRIWLKEVGSSTHYHATYVKPRWARSMEKVSKIGLHIFYRTFGGGWS